MKVTVTSAFDSSIRPLWCCRQRCSWLLHHAISRTVASQSTAILCGTTPCACHSYFVCGLFSYTWPKLIEPRGVVHFLVRLQVTMNCHMDSSTHPRKDSLCKNCPPAGFLKPAFIRTSVLMEKIWSTNIVPGVIILYLLSCLVICSCAIVVIYRMLLLA